MPPSNPFTYLFLRVPVFAVFLGLRCATALSAQTLMWNANTETNLAGYRRAVRHRVRQSRRRRSTSGAHQLEITGLTGRVDRTTSASWPTTVRARPARPPTRCPTGCRARRPRPTPTLAAVSPASGPTAGGTTITLTGTNFASGATRARRWRRRHQRHRRQHHTDHRADTGRHRRRERTSSSPTRTGKR